jgi:hypothetical protein
MQRRALGSAIAAAAPATEWPSHRLQRPRCSFYARLSCESPVHDTALSCPSSMAGVGTDSTAQPEAAAAWAAASKTRTTATHTTANRRTYASLPRRPG